MIRKDEDKKIIMKKKIIPYLSNGALIIGAVIGIYAFADIYILKSRLPAGVCPVTGNRPLMYASIGFMRHILHIIIFPNEY